MSIGFRALSGAILLAGCGTQAPDTAIIANVEAEQRAAAEEDGRIECAADAQVAMAATCTLQQTASADGTVLTLRQADGAFHRLLVTRDGRGVIAADGSEAAGVTVIGNDRIEVAIGGAFYRLPATVGPVTRP